MAPKQEATKRTPKRTPKREASDTKSGTVVNRDWSSYTHIPPSQKDIAKNGRRAGRVLINWNRPRMMEKLMLHVEYECQLRNMKIPWGNIAHRLSPGSSGSSIQQHLGRLRRRLITEGHMVPPTFQKPNGPKLDPKIRGFVRKHQDASCDYQTTRPVPWTEPMEDREHAFGDEAYATVDDALEDVFDGAGGKAVRDVDVVQRLKPENFLNAGTKRATPLDDEDFTVDGKMMTPERRTPRSLKRPTCSAAKKGPYSAGSDSEEDDYFEDDDEEQDPTEQVYQHSQGTPSKRVKRANPAQPRRPQFVDAPYDAAFQRVYGVHQTPAPRGNGIFAAKKGTPDGPVTPISHDNGKTWELVPYPAGSSAAFGTVASSPSDFDIANATPNAAAFMQAHLNEYNSVTIDPSLVGRNKNGAMTYSSLDPDLLDGCQGEEWEDWVELPSMFPPPSEL